jgi:hypothetical protein
MSKSNIRLARTVRPQERDDFPGAYLEVDAVQDIRGPVPHPQVANFGCNIRHDVQKIADLPTTSNKRPIIPNDLMFLVIRTRTSPGVVGSGLRWLAPARHPADDFQWLAA